MKGFCRCFPDVDNKVISSACYLDCAVLDLFGVVTTNLTLIQVIK